MLHLQTYGHGPRAFLGLHGWGAHQGKSFGDLVDHLPQDVTLHALDMPGCGRSPPLTRWSWEGVTDALAGALDGIKAPEPLTLVGSCSGAFHALSLLASRPERVGALVMLEPFARIPWFFSIFLTPGAGPLLYRMVFDNPAGRHLTQRHMARRGVSQEYDMVGGFARSGDLKVAYRYLQFYGELGDYRAFQGTPIRPVHIIHGQQSWGAILESPPLWQELFPQAKVTALAGVGHMFSQEAPERAARAIFSPF